MSFGSSNLIVRSFGNLPRIIPFVTLNPTPDSQMSLARRVFCGLRLWARNIALGSPRAFFRCLTRVFRLFVPIRRLRARKIALELAGIDVVARASRDSGVRRGLGSPLISSQRLQIHAERLDHRAGLIPF
jgi:hypothetical protein